MLNIINSDKQSLIHKLERKKLIVYGAGKKAQFFLENYGLTDKVLFLIDKNENINTVEIAGTNYPVYRVRKLIEIAKKEEIVLLITPVHFAMEIVDELDGIKELDGIDCYILDLMQEYCDKRNFSFSEGKELIPRKIHYCWFGGGKKSVLIEECIASWKEMCPEYEIICWNESNYDISKNEYMKQAYETGRLGFVPDYARLDIIYNEGGIYLDTDVKLVKPLDDLLKDELYFGLLRMYQSGFGLGFGAVKGHELIRQFRDYYDGMCFIKEDGTVDERPCSYFQDPVLKEYGFKLNNQYEKIGKVVCYPSYIFNPTGTSGVIDNSTEKTISIHYGTNTWLDDKTRREFMRYRTNINNRMKNNDFPN